VNREIKKNMKDDKKQIKSTEKDNKEEAMNPTEPEKKEEAIERTGKDKTVNKKVQPAQDKITEDASTGSKQMAQDGTDIFDDNEEMSFNGAKLDEKESSEEDVSKKAAKGNKSKKDKKDKKEKKGKKSKKKKKKKIIKRTPIGAAYVQATYNNTIVTLADLSGNVLCSSSAGRLGFKGPKKATPYAASIIVKDVIGRSKEYGLQSVSVFVKGVGAGRESAVRALNANGLNIIAIKDVTPIPHNGCRAKNPRRI